MARYKGSNRLKNLQKTIEDINTIDTTPTMSDKIGNYETRLNSVGINPEQATDKRNWFEKLTNLPEGQNALFDIGELISRPQQALFTGIDEAINGRSFLEGAKAGFTGEDTTNAGDILRDLGVNDDELFTNPITGDPVSQADLFGLVGDIFADPVDLALFAATPVTGGASAAALAAKEGTEAAKTGAKVAKAIDKGADALRAVDKGLDIAKAADEAADATKYVYKFNPLKAMFQKDSKSALEMAIGGVGKVAKKGLGISDDLITKGLSKVDNKTYYNAIRQLGVDNGIIKADGIKKLTTKQLDNVAKKLSDIGVDLTKYTDNLGGIYKGAKQGVKTTANYAKSIPDNLYNKINKSENLLDSVKLQSDAVANEINNNVTKFVKKYGGKEEDLLDDISTLITSKYAPEINGREFLSNALKEGKATIKGSEDELKGFMQSFSKGLNKDGRMVDDILNFKLSPDGTTLTLKPKNKKALGNIVNNNANKDILENIKYAKKQILDKSTQQKVNELAKKYADNIDFKNLVDNSEKSYRGINALINEATGGNIDFGDMMNKAGFTGNILTKEGAAWSKKAKVKNLDLQKGELNIGSKAVTSEKKFSNVAEQAEREMHSAVIKQADIKTKQLENLKDHKAKVADIESKMKAAETKRAEFKAIRDDNIAKLNISKAEKQKLTQGTKNELDELKNIVTDTMKKADNLVDGELPNKLIKKANDYTDSIENVNNWYTKLNNPNLLEADLDKVYKGYKDAQAKMLKKQQSLYLEKARIDGALVKKQEKNISKAVDMTLDGSSKYTKKMMSNEKELNKVLNKIKSVDASYERTARNLDRQINNLGLELDQLKNMTPDEILKYNDKMTKRAQKLQEDIDFLKSAEGIKFYETSFTQNLGDFVNRTIQDAKNINRYNEILLHSGLNDSKVLKFMPKGESLGKIPAGYTILDSKEANQMISFLENKKNFLPESSDLIKELKSRISDSSAIYINKDLKPFLKLNFTENEVKPFVKMIDGFNNTFKKYKVFTPGFHLRNISGNATNMIMSGVPISKIPGLYTEANRLVDKKYVLELFDKKALGKLTESELKDFNMINKFMQGGFLGRGKEIQDLADVFNKASKDVNKGTLKKAIDKVFTSNMNLNEWVDNRNRMALLLHAERNPKYLAKLGVNDSISAVKKVLFDPSNLSPFEKNVMKRLVPFYTFTKQNLMFHADNIMKNTSKYNRLIKTLNETYDALPEDSYRQYQKENMQIPIGTDDEGNVTTLKTNLPVSDLGEYMSNPLQRMVSSVTPLIKAPVEKVTGKDTFTGQDLYKSGPDQLASWLGIDTLTTSQANKISNLINDYDSDASASKLFADLLPSVAQYTDASKVANQKQYEELMDYQNYVNAAKNKGMYIPNISELKQFDKFENDGLKNYNGLTPKQQEAYDAYAQYQDMLSNLAASGIDVPSIKSLVGDTDATIKRIKKLRDKQKKRR